MTTSTTRMYVENNFISFVIHGKCKNYIQKAKDLKLICLFFFEIYSLK